jgi:2-C-methyl-D-erythritol 2,4-cyclodiphosphate synthase
MDSYRVGNGFDVHPFVLGRDLILGGKKIPHKFGLAGHSDADVLVHAVIDAILGASGMPDIGQLFPDTDNRYRGISSIKLLEEVGRKLEENKIEVINVDSVVVCQEPRIAPHINDMKHNISRSLHVDPSRIGIKGKTTEGLGFTGRGEGIEVYSVSLIRIG